MDRRSKRPRGPNGRFLVGNGAYHHWGPSPGADLGRSVGKWFGFEKQGAALGHFAGTLLGSGDYHSSDRMINTNSIINPSSSPPMLISGTGNGFIIRRREYIKDIVSSSVPNTFVQDTYSINPGQAKTFPWLATVAENFEQYRIRGMVFEFVSLSGDATSTTATSLGYVAMATQYDVLDPPFRNKEDLQNYDMSQSCKPSRNQIHGVECDPGRGVMSELYTRVGAQPPLSDLRLYDFAAFTIANAAPGVSVTLGELWVSYDIELIKPKLPANPGGSIPSLWLSRVNNTVSPVMGFGQVSTKASGNTAFSCDNTTLTLRDLRIGHKYQVSAYWFCTTAINARPALGLTSGALPFSMFGNTVGDPNFSSAFAAGAIPDITAMFSITFIAASSTVTVVCTPGTMAAAALFGCNISVVGLDATVT